MRTVRLNDGNTIPAIGFGTWQMHGGDARESVAAAIGAGYRHVDTARIYLNEGAVGKALRNSDVPRDELFVTTKLWNTSHGRYRPHRALKSSLRRLKLDYVDLYLLHWPMQGRVDSWRALEELQQAGLARSIGVSNFTIKHLQELMDRTSVKPAVNQVEFHPFLYESQKELLEFCSGQGIVIEAYSPLAHGHRIDGPVVRSIGATHGKSPAQVMLRWAVQHGTVPLPKSTHPDRIAQNLDIFDFDLSMQEMADIDGLSDGTRTCWNPEDMA